MSSVRFCKPHVILLTVIIVVAIASSLHLLRRKRGEERQRQDTCDDDLPASHDGLGHYIPERPGSVQRNFTVVTAYFNLGSIQKGQPSATRGPSAYRGWMWPYRHVLNGVVAFFDDSDFAASFAELRKGLPTKIVVVNRSDMWAFSLATRIQTVFLQPDYPKNHPKSTDAAYVSTMYAKYELVSRAVRDNPFGSPYFAWMDLGIYRYLPSDAADAFMLRAPACLRDSSVMFARIFPMDARQTAAYVLRNGLDWVGGGFFVAEGEVMLSFCEDYRKHAAAYLSAGLANHDQSVILAMYLPEAAAKPAVPLQAVVPRGDDPWFYLPLQARRDGLANAAAAASNGSRAAAFAAHRVCCSYELHE